MLWERRDYRADNRLTTKALQKNKNMDKVELKVMGITYNPVQNGAYALLLREVNGQHRIPIVVGASEAHSIAVRLENMIPPRPLTHDLMTAMLHAYGISV